MSHFIGIIDEIKEENIGAKYYKKVLTIVQKNQTGYFEFRSPVLVKFLDNLKVGDEVSITYLLQGKTTKSLMKCNNLVGQSIEKITKTSHF